MSAVWLIAPTCWGSDRSLKMNQTSFCFHALHSLSLSPSPSFNRQGLVGEKYGSIRVPGEVESAEFEMILDAAVEAGLDTHILEEWYCRDENSVPPAYYLKPKAQMLKNYQNSVSPNSTADPI